MLASVEDSPSCISRVAFHEVGTGALAISKVEYLLENRSNLVELEFIDCVQTEY